MRNTEAEKQLKEAWNCKSTDKYDALLKLYKMWGYKIKRNDKTGDHIVDKQEQSNIFGTGNPFDDIYGNMFKGGRS